ncbi:MAG: O-antigen ligase family protein [Candidatus Falkowbacteria bacterium]
MSLITKKTVFILGVITILELISLAAYFFPTLKIISTIVIFAIILILTLKNLENGLLIIFAELIIGSKGHLFELGPVSLRMLIFAAILLAYLISLFKKEERLKIWTFLKESQCGKYFGALAIFVILALATALIYGNSLNNILADFNAWLFFLLLFPILSVYFKASAATYQRLIPVVIAAFLWLGLETLSILYIFTHNIAISSDLYFWLRKTGEAEITSTLGAWPRIFLQSQIYAAIALVIMPFSLKLKKISTWALMTLAWSVLILSMSRSFWLATAAVLVIGLLWQIIFCPWRKIWSEIILISATAIGSVILILIIVLFPIPKPGTFSTDSFISRLSLNSNEAAVASRWSLLPVMWQEIKRAPLLGFGYGKTITYKSSDPRILQNNPDGTYSTYAFEWGYLSLWLKFGLFGLLTYLTLFLMAIYKGLLKWRQGDNLAGVLALGLLVLIAVNFFTPYLDHPLGIGYLLLAVSLISLAKIQKNTTLPKTCK